MSWATRNAVFGTAASVSVALLGLTLMWPVITQQATQGTDMPLFPERDVIPTRDSSPSKLVSEEPQVVFPVQLDVPAPAMELPAVQIAPSHAETIRAEPSYQPRQFDRPEEIVVTGIRGSLQQSLEVKRSAVGVVDSISAEDIGRFPDTNVPEALQRISGVSADEAGGDEFEHFETNPIQRVQEAPVSTFSIDVDTASYSYTRAMINDGVLPEKDAVRAEEMINYFDYAWPGASSSRQPFKSTIVVTDSPWNAHKKLIHIGIKGYDVPQAQAPDANLVFLLDVSGSMNEPNKLPLVKESMQLLLSSLKPTDTVAVVVYAGAAGVVLTPTQVRDSDKIAEALNKLQAGGSTAGSEGIKLAYELAEANFRKDGVNRILLATDGDFNVGITDDEELKGFVERQRHKGIFLSVLGFGLGNYHDGVAQTLAQNGNGVAAYIDTLNEAKKVLVQEASASLFTIAKDVKLQVEFNPATVAEYRLIGYETRALEREDFNNDAVDAGDIGSGHTVTAIYEITPVGSRSKSVDQLRYARETSSRRVTESMREYGFLKIRYKLPTSDRSELIEQPIPIRSRRAPSEVLADVEFSTAVAGFAQLLRGGKYTGSLTFEDILDQAQRSRGEDAHGYRAEFIDLVRKAQAADEM